MARDVSASTSGSSTVRPSRMIQALAAFTAIYFAIAVYYGALHAVKFLDFVLAATVVATLALVAIVSQTSWRFGAVLALCFSFVLQLAWAGWVQPAPIGDDQDLLIMARKLAATLQTGSFDLNLIYQSSSPSASMLYAFVIAVFGDELSFLRVVSAGLWTAQAWLVWRICEEVSELRPRAFVAAMMFGLAPSIIVFGAIPSIEAVFGFFALLSVYLVLSHRKRGLGLSALMSGVCGAFAYLAHPSGLAYVAGLIVVLLVGLSWERRWPGRWRMGLAVLACVGGFAMGVAPQVMLNKVSDGRWTTAPGLAIGYNLLYGTEFATGGDVGISEAARNVGLVQASDQRTSEGGFGIPLRRVDYDARRVALQRIADDPQAFVIFALTTKMGNIWSSERVFLNASRLAPDRDPQDFDKTMVGQLAPSIIDGVYFATLLLATAGAVRLMLRGGGVRDPTRWVLVLVAILCLAAANILFIANPRSHLAFTPLLVLLAPMAVAPLPRVVSARAEARAREAAAEERRIEAEKAFDLAEIHRPKPVDPEVAKQSPEERLANVLRGMSKPPRPDDDEEPNGGASQPST